MPTYEYKCSKCEEIFEYFQRMTDEPLKICPVCGGEIIRLISGGMGIIFKGSGFYTTDYKNSSSKNFSQTSKESEEKEILSEKSDRDKSNSEVKDTASK